MPSPRAPSGSKMVTAKLFVSGGALLHASGNETFLPPQSCALAAWREARGALSGRLGEVSVKRSSAMAVAAQEKPPVIPGPPKNPLPRHLLLLLPLLFFLALRPQNP